MPNRPAEVVEVCETSRKSDGDQLGCRGQRLTQLKLRREIICYKYFALIRQRERNVYFVSIGRFTTLLAA